MKFGKTKKHINILCVTDKEHSKCFYGIQLMQSFVCIYSISEKYRFVKRYLENKTQDAEKKDWIEELVVRFTAEKVLTDENIKSIAKRAMELIEKESADTAYLEGLRADLKETQRKIKNLVSAIEQGIVSATTKERLNELERDKTTIEGQIAREEMKKPLLTEERIRYWLTSFKNGDRKDKAYQRKIIDTLANSVYVYDEDDGGKRIVLTFGFVLTLKNADF